MMLLVGQTIKEAEGKLFFSFTLPSPISHFPVNWLVYLSKEEFSKYVISHFSTLLNSKHNPDWIIPILCPLKKKKEKVHHLNNMRAVSLHNKLIQDLARVGL